MAFDESDWEQVGDVALPTAEAAQSTAEGAQETADDAASAAATADTKATNAATAASTAQDAADAAQETADATRNHVTSNDDGLFIHESEGDEDYNVGSYTRVYSDGIEVGQDGTWISRFLSNALYLGKWFGSATEAAIYMFENKAISFLKGGTRDTIRFGGDGLANAQLCGYETLIRSGAAYQGVTIDTVDSNFVRRKELLDDWVISESSNKDPRSGWVWRKWASGVAEAWWEPYTAINVTSAFGACYYGTFNLSTTLPFTFAVAPLVSCAINGSGGSTWAANQEGVSTTSIGKWHAISALSLSGYGFYFGFSVKGKWR